jgi:hypothetical protein
LRHQAFEDGCKAQEYNPSCVPYAILAPACNYKAWLGLWFAICNCGTYVPLLLAKLGLTNGLQFAIITPTCIYNFQNLVWLMVCNLQSQNLHAFAVCKTWFG